MKKFIYIFDFFILVTLMLLGIFEAIGVCVVIWGGSVLKTALDSPPDLTHPACITFLLIGVTGMLAGAFVAIFGIMIPMHVKFKVPFKTDNSMLPFIKFYSTILKNFLDGNNGVEN